TSATTPAHPMSHSYRQSCSTFLFFFNHPTTTQIYTLSLHDALPISVGPIMRGSVSRYITTLGFSISWPPARSEYSISGTRMPIRSEEHTSELQSRGHLVCRLLLEKKNKGCRVLLTGTSICTFTLDV